MVIYGDILFLVNLYVDYFLLLAVRRFLHLPAKRLQLLLGAVLGAAFSLFSLLEIPELLTYLISALFALLISLVAFSPPNKKALLKATACFFAFNFAFGGIVLLLAQMTGEAAVIRGSIYFDLSPVFLFLFTVLSYFVSLLLEKLRGRREPDKIFCKILVEHRGEKAELLGKIDTGNTLKEPFSDLPVLVAEKKIFAEILRVLQPVDFRVVPFASVGGKGLLEAFRPEHICIKSTGQEFPCYLALYDGSLSAGSWNCLVNPQILEIDTLKGGLHEI
ncbi:MAG: sigma-E processing peptidase SpoIIGA [Oscillospiraceae bacterium]